MDLIKIREQKTELETAITKLIDDFQTQTGVVVHEGVRKYFSTK